jgi:hypothetical protein
VGSGGLSLRNNFEGHFKLLSKCWRIFVPSFDEEWEGCAKTANFLYVDINLVDNIGELIDVSY